LNRLLSILTYCILATTPLWVDGQDLRGSEADKGLDASSFTGKRPMYRGAPNFFERQRTKGSPYLSSFWLYGVIGYSNGTVSPKPDPYAYNYDKINNRLVATRDGKKMVILSNDSIGSFALSDSNIVYLFEKVPFVNHRQFFQMVMKSDKGYCLYKRLITKLRRADFKSLGYVETGKRYDEFVDDDEYFITFPGKKKFKKCFLKMPAIRKALRSEAGNVDDFLKRNKGPLTEDTLADLLRFLNDKIACCTIAFQKFPILPGRKTGNTK
jgi:hypothetical protein